MRCSVEIEDLSLREYVILTLWRDKCNLFDNVCKNLNITCNIFSSLHPIYIYYKLWEMWIIIIQKLLIFVYNMKYFSLYYTVAYAQEVTVFDVAMGSKKHCNNNNNWSRDSNQG